MLAYQLPFLGREMVHNHMDLGLKYKRIEDDVECFFTQSRK